MYFNRLDISEDKDDKQEKEIKAEEEEKGDNLKQSSSKTINESEQVFVLRKQLFRRTFCLSSLLILFISLNIMVYFPPGTESSL